MKTKEGKVRVSGAFLLKVTITYAVLVAIALVSHSAKAQQPATNVGTVQQPLYVLSTAIWSHSDISVCFEEDGFADEKQWVREAVTSSWQAASNVRFYSWGLCKDARSSDLRVHFQDARGFTQGLGAKLSNVPNGVNLNTWATGTCVPGWARQRCVSTTAVHEFGHALGFAHEMNRDDRAINCLDPPQGSNGDTKVGAFDMMSVLNYCNPVRNGDGRLSRNDIQGVRRFYGWSDTNAYPRGSLGDDRKSDFMVWRPSDGNWYKFDPQDKSVTKIEFDGQKSDIPVRMDVNGDGQKDIVVWRPSEGNWYIKNLRIYCSFEGIIFQKKVCTPDKRVLQWGKGGDVPVPADYDGDGIDDFVVWRPSEASFYGISSLSGVRGGQLPLGLPGDVPVPGDYDGDGRTDFMVYRPSNGMWYGISSLSGAEGSAGPYGVIGDVPVPGDYDGDGRADLAVWRPSNGTWYVFYSSLLRTFAQRLGQSGDIPVPGDYDNDYIGRTDFAVWRPSNRTWYWINDGGVQELQFGVDGDIPLGSRLLPR